VACRAGERAQRPAGQFKSVSPSWSQEGRSDVTKSTDVEDIDLLGQ
jgi:hypothetical protein